MQEAFMEIINFLKNNTNIGTLLVALLTFLITFANFYRNRASIKVRQFPGSQANLIKPDFIDMKTPDVYWHNEYRLIIDITITNESAKPISIVEFALNSDLKFNSYHWPGSLYQVTTKPGKTIHNGVVAVGSSQTINYPIKDKWLQPIIDIPPYTSVRGHLFFHFPDEEMVKKHGNKLEIFTSRKTFIKYLDLCEFQMSRLPLPDKIEKARTRRSE